MKTAKTAFAWVVLGACLSAHANGTANEPAPAAAATPPAVAAKKKPKSGKAKSEATKPSSLKQKIAAGLQITIEQYDSSVDAFWLISNREPDYGPLYVTPEDLMKGVGFEGDLKKFMRRPDDLVGRVYQLQNDVPVLLLREMYERGKKLGTIK